VNSAPFLAAATGREERNHAYSVRMAASTVTGFLGSLVGGTLPGLLAPLLEVPLDHPAPYRYSLLGAAVLCVPAVPALLAMRSGHSASHTEAERGAPSEAGFPWAPLALMAAVMVLRAAGTGTSVTFFNVYLEDGLHVSTAAIGAIFAAIQLVSVPVSLSMPLVAQRWGSYRTIIWASLGSAVGMLPLALFPHWAAAAFGRLGVYALSALSDPALSVYQMETVHPRWRATMSAVSSTALGLSWTAFSFAGGHMIAALGYRTLFLLAAALTVLGTLLFWAYFRAPPIQPVGQAIINR
jgi:predicted MFS family arabinose efflux permease